MIKLKDIEKTIADMTNLGHDVSVRDISFVILSKEFDSASIAYKAIYGKDCSTSDIEKYDKCRKISALRTYIASNFNKEAKVSKKTSKNKTGESFEDISFEENKAAIIQLIANVKQAAKDGTIDPKDALKMELDARTKLNDKFDVEKEQGQQYVIVEKKFNHICPHLHKECYVYTKEDLMEKYGLIEKPNDDE